MNEYKGTALNVICVLSQTLPQIMRKSDFFKKQTIQQMIAMVASVNMSTELQEWQEDLADSTV